jgi:two-component system NtrC family response regulator
MTSILVVDDDMSFRGVVADLLTGAGHVVRQAVTGEHALAVILAQPPDLVLCDITMPLGDGLDLTAAVAERAPAVRVVLMSGACRRPGAWPAPCLAKPFDADRLLALGEDLVPA